MDAFRRSLDLSLAILIAAFCLYSGWRLFATDDFTQRQQTVDEMSLSEFLRYDSLNLNTADREALVKLPGVGEAIAQNILDYREASGGFASPEELLNVRYIGEKRYAELMRYVYAE